MVKVGPILQRFAMVLWMAPLGRREGLLNPARAKVESEGCCRVCSVRSRYCDAAHTFDRSLSRSGFTEPDLIVPLCSHAKGGNGCHDAYDAHQLDLLPWMTTDEQVALVRAAGSIERARNRAMGRKLS